MAKNPFATQYLIPLPRGEFVVLNGSQVTKIIAKKVNGVWQLSFHLSDGSEYGISPGEWVDNFVRDKLGITEPK